MARSPVAPKPKPRTKPKPPISEVVDSDYTKLVTLDHHIKRRPDGVDPDAFRAADPSGYIKWAKGEFCRALGSIGSVLSACIAIGSTREEVSVWRSDDKVFAKAWDNAILDSVERLENEAIRRAVHGVEEGIYFGARKIGTRKVYSDTLLKTLMEGNNPNKYRKNVTIEGGTTPIGVRVTDTRRESIAEKILGAIAAAEVVPDDSGN